MAANEEFDEKVSADSNTADFTTESNKEFAPINTAASGPATKLPSRSSRLSRVRSNNGYGCDDGNDSEEGPYEGEGAVTEKDPFEVQWDGGETDRMNPRSMSYARKWVIVLVVSASSLCV
jgi:hypothetical protein